MMKCEHCGRNEATFYCKENINGQVSQIHLCHDCARELGYTQRLYRSFRPMARSFFSPFSLLGDFEALTAPLGGMGLMTEFPAPDESAGEAGHTAAPSGGLVDEAEAATLRAQRQKNALKAQLESAVAEERYEDAAKLRDEIKRLGQQAQAAE